MNHLPVPLDKQPSNYPVVFLGQLPREAINFWDYATEQSLTETKAQKITPILTGYVDDPDFYFAKVQAWLYFGLLKQIFGASIVFQDFIEQRADGQKIINSTVLTSHVEQWYARSAKLLKAAQSAQIEQVKQCTELAWRCCDQYDGSEVPRTLMHMMVLFSIRILVSSVWDMLGVYGLEVKDLNESHRFSRDLVQWPRLPPSYRPVAMLMTEFGWCSHEILRLLSSCNCTTVWTITCVNRGETTVDHGRCHSAEKCVSRDVDPFFHQAEHLTPGCECDAIGPSIEEVNKILRAGGIPLVRCTTMDNARYDFKVIQAKRSRRHIALSHVWADGIVISQKNKVYRCQFSMIMSYLRMVQLECQTERLFFLPFAGWFAKHVFKAGKAIDIWYDIFCIPTVLDPEHPELRKQAIALINPIFAGAEAVLVIDKALTRAKGTEMSATEVLTRIAACGWMSRCWTLSEASLAYKSIMLFAVGERLVPQSDLNLSMDANHKYRLLNVSSKSIYRNLSQSLLNPFAVCWLSSQPVVSEYFAFVFIWNALTDRSTSWPDDAWGIAANLLGYSGKEIMALEEDRRLPALMRDLPKIPASFLFRDLPRSCEAPAHMRWIPRQIQGKIRDIDGSFGVTDNGLVLDKGAGTKLLFSVDGSLPRMFTLEFVRDSQTPSLSFKIDVHHTEALVRHAHTSAELCLVLRGVNNADGRNMPTVSGNGCLLRVAGTNSNGILETDFVSSISYESSFDKLADHYQSSIIVPLVMLSCDREQWYQPKIRRNKHRLAPWTISRLLYYGGPAVLVSLMCATMIPLWVVYRSSHQDALVLATCGWGLLLCVYGFLVIFHENFLFQNWFDSFLHEGKPQRWWKKIMPLW